MKAGASKVRAGVAGKIPRHIAGASVASEKQECGGHLPVGAEAENAVPTSHLVDSDPQKNLNLQSKQHLTMPERKPWTTCVGKAACVDDPTDLSPLH